ncbi:hypothetical protein [Marivita sp.]|uniref:hypothetical protein n=1 Tax=Marivita sp. TaxID=2003365 RepID=UPI0025C06895|nr:hypothetical protein [Marivita sp.]
MAAVSLIAGSILGWIAAAIALFLGALASTALVVFIATSLGFATLTLGAAHAIDTRTT